MKIREKKSYIESRLSQGDMFYQLFLGDCCLGKQCYEHCKYKYNHSSADIRIGDLWGKTYKDNEDGVSCAVAFTRKGDEILKQCNCELVEHSFDVVAEGQMKSMPKHSVGYSLLSKKLQNDACSIIDVVMWLIRLRKIERWSKRLFNNPIDFIRHVFNHHFHF